MADFVVYNFTDFYNALRTPTGPNTIYLGADIIMTSGVQIPRTAGHVTIDGLYPQDGTGTIHSITDVNSSSAANTINVPAGSGSISVTCRNIIFYGRNYYGMLYIADSSTNSGTVLDLININYTGPQMVHHRAGITRITDCSIKIGDYNGTVCPVQETGEINTIYFNGNVDIENLTTSDSCFWICNTGGGFYVGTGATLNIDNPGNCVFYSDSGAFAMEFGANSSTNISSKFPPFYNSSTTAHTASSIILRTGSSLELKYSTSRSVAALKTMSVLTIEEGCSLYIAAPTGSGAAAVRTTGSPNITITKPKRVVFYNGSSTSFQFGGNGTISVEAELVNYWLTPTPFPYAGEIGDIPLRAWRKADGSNVTVTASVTPYSVSSVTSNIDPAQDYGGVLNPSTYNLITAKVMSFGQLPFSVNEISDMSTAVFGASEDGAQIAVNYPGQPTQSGTASPAFSIPVPYTFVKGDQATVRANKIFLSKENVYTVAGSLRISHLPEKLSHGTIALPINRDIFKRRTEDWYIEITDTRDGVIPWTLYAFLSEPLTSGSNIIEDALIFKKNGSEIVFTSTELEVFASAGGTQITRVDWHDMEGILLKLSRGTSYNEGRYRAGITFYLE